MKISDASDVATGPLSANSLSTSFASFFASLTPEGKLAQAGNFIDHAIARKPFPVKQKEANRNKLVFVVDNEQVIARTLAMILERAGCHAAFFYSGEEAMAAAALQLPDLVVSDVVMDGISGIELKRRMQAHLPGLPFILLSGQARTSELIQKARRDGHEVDVYEKPMHPDTLILKVNRLLTA